MVLIKKKLSKKNKVKTKSSTRKVSKKYSRKVSKKVSRKVSKKNKISKKYSRRNKVRKSLKGGGPYKLTSPGGSCFSFTNFKAFSDLIAHIQKTFFSELPGVVAPDASILQRQMNNNRQGVQDLKIALLDLQTRNKKSGDMTVKAFEALSFIEKHISDKINDKRKKAGLQPIQKSDKIFLTDAPFKYDTMEDLWVNTIVKPNDSMC